MTPRIQNESILVLTETYTCQRWNKMYLKKCWTNPSHASEYIKFILTYADEITPMPVRTKPLTCQRGHRNISKHVLSTHIYCQRGHKMHLHIWWQTSPKQARTKNVCQHVLTKPPNSHASEDTKCASTCVYITAPITAKTQNESQLVLMKHIPWERGHKIYL